jgi:hypothetical protein
VANVPGKRFELRLELRRLEDRIRQARLRHEYELLARHALGIASREVARASPDMRRVADAVNRAAQLLRDGGAFGGSGRTLVDSLRRIVALLGPAGKTIVLAV